MKIQLSVLLDSLDTLKFAIWLEFSSLLKPLIYIPYAMGNLDRLL